MLRPPSIVAMALAIALLVYSIIVTGLLHRISVRLIQPMHLTVGPPYFNAPAREEQRDHIEILGVRIPFADVMTACLMIPALCLAHDFFTWKRRRRRERLNQCMECGHPIRRFSGRCPCCGVRIAPDRPDKVYVLRG